MHDGCWAVVEDAELHSEKVALRKGLPPLLVNLAERKAEAVQWLGVAFGLTEGLLAFWQRNGFSPVYLRQTPSDVTGLPSPAINLL